MIKLCLTALAVVAAILAMVAFLLFASEPFHREGVRGEEGDSLEPPQDFCAPPDYRSPAKRADEPFHAEPILGSVGGREVILGFGGVVHGVSPIIEVFPGGKQFEAC